MSGIVLTGCGVVLAAVLAGVAALGDLLRAGPAFVALFAVGSLAYGLAVVTVLRGAEVGARGLAGIVLAALVFRAVLLPTAPSLSTDVYRYLWDGRLTVAGISPYRYPADSPALAPFRDAVLYPRLNHRDWRTIYPPGAQLLFAAVALVAPGSVPAFKVVVLAFDLLTLALLAGWLRALRRPAAWILVYAWHPLVAVEVAGTGHLDAVVVAGTVAALWAATAGREALAGALLGAGTLVKLTPVLLLPAVWSRHPGRVMAAAAVVVAAGYVPHAGDGAQLLGSLTRFLAEGRFNGALPGVLEWALQGLGGSGRAAVRLLPLAAVAVLAVAVGIRAVAVPAWRRAGWLIGAYLLAVPSLFAWYAVSLVPVLAVAPSWPWLYLTCAVALPYAVFQEPVWTVPGWMSAAEFLPVVLGLALAAWAPMRPVPPVGSQATAEVSR